MPRPFTGGCGFRRCRRWRFRRRGGFAVGLRFRCGAPVGGGAAGGLLGAGPAGARCDAEALDLGFRLGGRGRLRGCFGRCRGRLRRSRCGSGLLGAGSAGACGDAEALDLGFGLAVLPRLPPRRRCSAAGGRVFLAPGRLAPPAMPRPLTGALRPRASSSGGRRLRRSLLGAGAFCAARDAEAGDRLGFGSSLRSAFGFRLRRFGLRPRRCGLALAGGRGLRACGRASAAAPLAGSVTLLLSSDASSSWATSSTSAFSLPMASARSSTPSVIITRQNGQPVAIFDAPVSSASSTRSWLTRLPMCSSIHIRAPPAPQHRPRSAWRGISVSVAPDAPISSRGAS